MASSPEVQGMAIVLMGVSGAGKSTIGEMLGKSMSCTFLDADDFHPEPNKEKMRKGIPLSEEDRIPWLEMLRDALKEKIMVMGETVILGCSALRKHYRDILRSADPSYRPGIYKCAVKFVLLEVGEGELAARLARRAMEGKHFMSAALLSSQLALLEVDDECEGILKIDATLSPPGPEAVSFAAFQTNNSKSDNLTYAVCKDAPFAHRVPLSSPLGSDHTMEFLCRSWSPSSLNFHQILTSQNLMLPNSTIGGSEEASDYEGKEEEKTYQRQILCNRYADNTLHEPWGWLKGKTLISKFKLYRERKKQEVRLQTANLDAALSLTQLAAAIAGLTSNMPDTSIVPEQSPVLAYDQDNMNDVVASAAALMTTVCAEVAESLGALRSRVAGAVKSGLATRTPIDMITLTATAATCLRGAATLKSRAIADTCLTRHQGLLRAGAELFIIMPSGKQAFKWVAVYLKNVQVIFSFRKKYLQGVLTAMKECIVSSSPHSIEIIFMADKFFAVVEEKNIDQGYMFLCLKTKHGIIKLQFQDEKQFLIWASTISKLLKMQGRC